MKSAEAWRATFDQWAGDDPLIASTGEPSNPAEMASVGLVIGDWLELGGTQRVLDVGCASGTLTSMWAHRARSVVGVDFSEALLEDGRRYHSDSNIEFIHADASDLPFGDDEFDGVCCFGVLLCLPDHEFVDRAIDEILRVAKPGARIVLGSMPDSRRRSVFFDHCDAMTAWYRRMIPRDIRWRAKRVLKPGSKPGQTAILWFDPETLAERLRSRGLDVRIEADPEYSNYADYRKSLVISSEPATATTPVTSREVKQAP